MIKKHKGILITAALILALSGTFVLGTFYEQGKATATVLASETGFDNTANPGEASLEISQMLLEESPDIPLLQENATENWGDSSLENLINDINAASGAKDAILQICEDAGIDADTAVVSDLTAEQIHQIDWMVYQNSDHSKN